MQKRLDLAKASHVEKAVARSWVVNYVEAGAGPHGEELLQLMAEWWEFTPEDRLRVGLLDGMPHPSCEALLTPLEYMSVLRVTGAAVAEDADACEIRGALTGGRVAPVLQGLSASLRLELS